MARIRSRTVAVSRSGSRRLVDWGISAQNTSFSTLATVTTVNLGGGASLAGFGGGEPFTIVRARGLLTIVSDQQAAGENQIGAFGAVIVQLRAAAAGVASLPRPQSDPFADWFVYQSFAQRFMFLDATGVEPRAGVQYVLDSKAQRKVDSPTETSLALMLENASTTGLLHNLHIRFLLKFA